MRLLPTAPRSRRLVIGGVLLLAASAQAWRPQPLVDQLLDPFHALLAPITRAAGWLEQGLQAKEEQRPEQSPSLGPALGALERQMGQPQAIPGMAWLEVPVLSVDSSRQQMEIVADPDLALAEGMPVAFGDRYLGRLVSLEAGRGVIRTWKGADMRTGLAWENEGKDKVRGVALGRGAGGAPVVKWQEEEQDLREGASVWWRPHPGEPPQLVQAGLRLGQLQRQGSAARGTQLWVVEGELPTGAEGRVFLAAGAVSDRLVAEAPVIHAPASLLLRTDAVLGSGWARFQVPGADRFRVLTGGEMVLGHVRQSAGGMLWVHREGLAAWWEDAVLVQEQRILSVTAGREADEQGRWCTRGLEGVPRGLWLGELEEVSWTWPAPYQVWAKQSTEPMP